MEAKQKVQEQREPAVAVGSNWGRGRRLEDTAGIEAVAARSEEGHSQDTLVD